MSLYPSAGAHAVQSAAFALEWPVELTDSDLGHIGAVQMRLRQSLPNMQPIQAMMVQMLAGGGPPAAARPITGGFQLSRSGPAGPIWTLEIQRNRLVGQINDYTRWKLVWAEVKSWFAAAAPFLDGRQIASVGLHYTDVFHWRAPPEQLDLSQVFRRESRLLPPHVFETKSFWHSHHGYFIQQDEPTPHRLLENVNVDMMENLGQQSFVITTVHRAEVKDIWGWENLEKVIDPLMETLHARNKAALGDLLAEPVAKTISLFGGA